MKTVISIFVIALGFAMVVAGCDSGVTPVESTQPELAQHLISSKVPKSLKGGSKCPCFKEKDLEAVWWDIYYDNFETWGSIDLADSFNDRWAAVSHTEAYGWSCAFATEEGSLLQNGITEREGAECRALIEERAHSQVPPPVCCLL